LESKMGHLTAN